MDKGFPRDPRELVDCLADPDRRFSAYQALVALGDEALPAVREGFGHDHWQVRKWCAMCLDQIADGESLAALVPLLRDPKSDVRLWAVHSIACDHCKDGQGCPVDVVPHLIERIEVDDSVRVRRMATIMLGTDQLDVRAVPALEKLRGAEDAKLRRHAERTLETYRASGLIG